jgi:hypothetical protein
MEYYIGCDLGQMCDYTAFTVVEKDGGELRLRHIERPRLGTSYLEIVDGLKTLAESPRLEGRKTVMIDKTGVGGGVWDMVRDARIRADVKGVMITGGDKVTYENGVYRIPKRDLVSSLQIAFQNGRLKIANGLPHADAFLKELANYQVKINIHGNDQYEPWRSSVHDDIIMSISMAVWMASRQAFNIKTLIS